MVEKQIKDHSAHLSQLTAKAMTNKAEAIKELIDYIILSHASAYVTTYFSLVFSFYSVSLANLIIFNVWFFAGILNLSWSVELS